MKTTRTITDTEGCKFDIVCESFLHDTEIHVGVWAHPQNECSHELFDIDWDKDNGTRFNCPDGINVQWIVIQTAYNMLSWRINKL